MCQRLEVPPADAYGVATCSTPCSRRRPDRRWCCTSATTSRVRAPGPRIFAASSNLSSVPPVATHEMGMRRGDEQPMFGFQCVSCPGSAAALRRRRAAGAPVRATIDRRCTGRYCAARESPRQTSSTLPRIFGSPLRLLQRVGVVDPGSVDDYRKRRGYGEALSACISSLDRRASLPRSSRRKLLGRGGAAFPHRA